jgi:hypothetical protein
MLTLLAAITKTHMLSISSPLINASAILIPRFTNPPSTEISVFQPKL